MQPTLLPTKMLQMMLVCCSLLLLLGSHRSHAFVLRRPSQVSRRTSHHHTDISQRFATILAATTRSTTTRLNASKEKNAATTKPKKKQNRRRNKNHGKPRSRKSNLHGVQQNPQRTATRPLLVDYRASCDPRLNDERLEGTIADCGHFGTCPGCVVNEAVADIGVMESATRFFSSTLVRKSRNDVADNQWMTEQDDDGFLDMVVPSEITEWRTQAKLVVAPRSSSWKRDEGCVFGLYQRRSHEIVPIPNCTVHHPSITKAVELLERATTQVGTPAFTQDNRDGGLRYVQLQVERITGKVCLTLVWAADDIKETHPWLSRLVKALTQLDTSQDVWHSMWCHCNNGMGNNIFARNSNGNNNNSKKNWHRLSGPEFVKEPLPTGNHGWLYFTPLTFRQGNMDGFDIIANDVARLIPGGSKVCELYAGVGMLGLTALLHHHQKSTANDNNARHHEPLVWVRCSDENPANARCFSRSLNTIPKSTTYHDESQGSDGGDKTLRELVEMMETGEMPEESDRTGPKIGYLVADAATALLKGEALGADVMVVDPPRKGLDEEVLDQLCKPHNPKQAKVESAMMLSMEDRNVNWTNDVRILIYVSCGFDALARDTEQLLTSRGGWKLESSTGFVLFPGSNHVETLCVFEREIHWTPP